MPFKKSRLNQTSQSDEIILLIFSLTLKKTVKLNVMNDDLVLWISSWTMLLY